MKMTADSHRDDPVASHQRIESFLAARRVVFDHLLEDADLDRLVTDQEYQAQLSAQADRAAAKELSTI